jgi:hypothetical protein
MAVKYNNTIYSIFADAKSDTEAAKRAFAFFNSLPLSDWSETPWWRGAQPAKDPAERINGGLMIALWIAWNPSFYERAIRWGIQKGYTNSETLLILNDI